MPTLDRKILVRHTPPGMRNQYGEFVAGTPVNYPVWATVMPKSLTDIHEEGGARGEARRDWRIRWVDGLYGVNTALLTVTDGERIDETGDSVPWVWSVANLVEFVGRNGELRRRWMTIEGLFST